MSLLHEAPATPITTVTVRHRNGRTVTWHASSNSFTGDDNLVYYSNLSMEVGGEVELGENDYLVGPTPNGAAAAMLTACCGQGVVLVPASDDQPAYEICTPPF